MPSQKSNESISSLPKHHKILIPDLSSKTEPKVKKILIPDLSGKTKPKVKNILIPDLSDAEFSKPKKIWIPDLSGAEFAKQKLDLSAPIPIPEIITPCEVPLMEASNECFSSPKSLIEDPNTKFDHHIEDTSITYPNLDLSTSEEKSKKLETMEYFCDFKSEPLSIPMSPKEETSTDPSIECVAVPLVLNNDTDVEANHIDIDDMNTTSQNLHLLSSKPPSLPNINVNEELNQNFDTEFKYRNIKVAELINEHKMSRAESFASQSTCYTDNASETSVANSEDYMVNVKSVVQTAEISTQTEDQDLLNFDDVVAEFQAGRMKYLGSGGYADVYSSEKYKGYAFKMFFNENSESCAKEWEKVSDLSNVMPYITGNSILTENENATEFGAQVENMKNMISPLYKNCDLQFSKGGISYQGIIVMKFGGQDLWDIIAEKHTKNLPTDETQGILLLKQMAEALQFLSQGDVAHNDIKVENILYNKDQKQFYLADFGLMTKITEKTSSPEFRLGTLTSTSPEYFFGSSDSNNFKMDMFKVLLIKKYGDLDKRKGKEGNVAMLEKEDVWGLGIALLTFFSQDFAKLQFNTSLEYAWYDDLAKHLNPANRSFNFQRYYQSENVFDEYMKTQIEIPEIPIEVQQLLKRMLKTKHEERISATELVEEAMKITDKTFGSNDINGST